MKALEGMADQLKGLTEEGRTALTMKISQQATVYAALAGIPWCAPFEPTWVLSNHATTCASLH